MTFVEILISSLIGIISGIVSGYMVTRYYRAKDAQREIKVALKQMLSYGAGVELGLRNWAKTATKDIYAVFDALPIFPIHAVETLKLYGYDSTVLEKIDELERIMTSFLAPYNVTVEKSYIVREVAKEMSVMINREILSDK